MIEAAEHFLPKDIRIPRAFDLINSLHTDINTPEDIVRLNPAEASIATIDYLLAGVAFLANRAPNEYLKLLGTNFWHVMSRNLLQIYYSNNIHAAMTKLGASQDLIAGQEPDDICTLFGRAVNAVKERVNVQVGIVLIPPHTILRAKRAPLDILASIAHLCSNVSDLTNGRLFIDPESISMRGLATRAQLLVEASSYPEEYAKLSEQSIAALRTYPQGIDSLPPQLKYTPQRIELMLNAANN